LQGNLRLRRAGFAFGRKGAQRVRGYGCTSNAFAVFAMTIVDAPTGRAPIDPTNPVFARVIPYKTAATGTVGTYGIGTFARILVALVFRARVVVIAVDVIPAATAIARIIRARDPVIAVRVGRAFSLFADAVHADTGSAVPVAGAAVGKRRVTDMAHPRMQRAVVGAGVLAELVRAFILVVVAVSVRPAFRLLSPTRPIYANACETAPFAGISVEGRSGGVAHGNARTIRTEIQAALVLVVAVLIHLAFRRTAPYERQDAQRQHADESD
jgi:hypothetical protein